MTLRIRISASASASSAPVKTGTAVLSAIARCPTNSIKSGRNEVVSYLSRLVLTIRNSAGEWESRCARLRTLWRMIPDQVRERSFQKSCLEADDLDPVRILADRILLQLGERAGLGV